MDEEVVRVQIVFSGFVYDSDHSMLSRKRVLKHRIEFPKLERRRIVIVPDAHGVVVVLDSGG